MAHARTLAVLVALVIGLAGCVDSPTVVEGVVAAADPVAGTLVLESNSGGALELSLDGAEVGAPPEPGDSVRAAYVERDGRLVALRVMNLTRQAELQK